MLTTYFRSSSIGTLKQCQLKYFLEYVLGFSFPAHISAWKGNIVHKGIELLARRKIAEQKKQKTFVEDGEKYKCSEVTPDFAFKKAVEVYTTKEPERAYTQLDIDDCYAWLNRHLTEYSHWSPLERVVVTAEDYFDISFDEDWAKYEFQIGNDVVKGNLAIKGTMDLLYEVDEHTYEYCDIKTGKRRDFNTGLTKDFEALREDIQLMLYYYALKHKYPDKNIFMTLLYISHGGPYPVPFDEFSIEKLKKTLATYFNLVKNIQVPSNIKGDFKCNFCPFKTNIYKNHTTFCDFFDIETSKVGVDLVAAKYGQKNMNYGTGGGRTHNEPENGAK